MKKKVYEKGIEVTEKCESKGFYKDADEIETTVFPSFIEPNSEVSLRLMSLKEKIRTEKNRNMDYIELLDFLQNVMNYDEMQIWLMRKRIDGVKLTLNDGLKKFFELKTDDDILALYDIEQNCNQNNIDNIRKKLRKSLN